MTIRLALVIPTMDQGGAEKQVCLLAENLPHDEFNVHVFLLTRDGPLSQRLRDAGVAVTLIGKRFKADPTALFRLRRALKQFQPDVVHTWLFAANSFGRMAAWMAGVKRIIASERCVDPWKTTWHFIIDRFLARHCEAITTNSHGVKDFYVSHGLSADLFCVIPNGIAPRSDPGIGREEAFERLDVDTEKKLIVAVGRLWPQKRYRDLIWSGELLATTRGDVVLVIVGDGPQAAELLRLRDSLTRPNVVKFAGHRDDVPSWLHHADVFWIGSEYEGQSNAVIEAMQAGVPVVASDIPGNRDLVAENETGHLVKLGDTADFARKTNMLLDDPQRSKQYGEAARKRIENEFSIQQMVQRHARLYRGQ